VFTGIIEEMGKVAAETRHSGMMSLSVAADKVLNGLNTGDSIAVNGTCLTVTRLDRKSFTVDIVKETLDRTNLKFLKVSDTVNLERSLKSGSPLGGHFVTGHIDGLGKVSSIDKGYIDITLPEDMVKYVVHKGSIALDGVSLTIGEVKENTIRIYLIPYTLKMTNLGSKRVGSLINVEVDILGKYVYKALSGMDIRGVADSRSQESRDSKLLRLLDS